MRRKIKTQLNKYPIICSSSTIGAYEAGRLVCGSVLQEFHLKELLQNRNLNILNRSQGKLRVIQMKYVYLEN